MNEWQPESANGLEVWVTALGERASFYPPLAQVLQAAGFKEGGVAHSNAGSAEWAGAFISARVQSVLLNARTLGPCRAIPLGPPSVRQGRTALSIGINDTDNKACS